MNVFPYAYLRAHAATPTCAKSLGHAEIQSEKAANKTNQFKPEQFKAEQQNKSWQLTKWYKVVDGINQFYSSALG